MDRVLILRLALREGEAVALLGTVEEKVQHIRQLRSVIARPDALPPDGPTIWTRLSGELRRAILAAREGDVLTVLVIEDQRMVRDLLVLTLELSYQVMSAGDGQSGLALLGLVRPDLVLLDLGLPDMHGLEVLRQIRRDPELYGTPVLILSGASGDLARPALAAGANGYLSKPYSPAYLLDRVAAILGSYDLHERVP